MVDHCDGLTRRALDGSWRAGFVLGPLWTQYTTLAALMRNNRAKLSAAVCGLPPSNPLIWLILRDMHYCIAIMQINMLPFATRAGIL
jgi:hypothetical protein